MRLRRRVGMSLALVAAFLLGGLTLGVAMAAAPGSYTPPCTSNTDSCRQQRIVALENHYKTHDHPTATPTPTATVTSTPTGTPTVTSTPTAPAGQVCTSPVWRSSTSNAMWSNGGYIVHNNMWNAGGYNVAQTVEACTYRSWNVIATADNSRGDGAVKTYPNVHKDYHNWSTGAEPPLSNYPTLRSTFAADGPDSGIYNIAYDIWLNGVPGNREIMIWTDNQGQTPAGSRVGTGLSVGGHTWDLWATGDNRILSFVATPEIPSGTLNLRAMLDYLIAQGRVPSSSTLGQICFGVEVVSTNGQPATFNVTDFSITDN